MIITMVNDVVRDISDGLSYIPSHKFSLSWFGLKIQEKYEPVPNFRRIRDSPLKKFLQALTVSYIYFFYIGIWVGKIA